MFYLYLTEKHTQANSGADSNAIQIRVDYWKGNGVMLFITGVEHKKEESLESFSYMPIGSPQEKQIWEKAERNPGKKGLPKILAQIKHQIDTKSGPAHDHLAKFIEKYQMQVEGQ